MNRDNEVYSNRVRDKLDTLEAKKHALELKVRDVQREIEELIVGQSPIRVGDMITWMGVNRERLGRVVSVRASYTGFQYRVEILTKAGRVIGIATVVEQDQPTLQG